MSFLSNVIKMPITKIKNIKTTHEKDIDHRLAKKYIPEKHQKLYQKKKTTEKVRRLTIVRTFQIAGSVNRRRLKLFF